ncbi:hypothetical protein H5V45_15710 [Nocardioides sp. KIGAM211]|uniref:Clp R domain-containing protein n=1 Tax=Nocardioides luti TaxID=2761101 RepID=A0A7X0RI65_9ACTN|nr:hypothetical protein [Nocardioides luti]
MSADRHEVRPEHLLRAVLGDAAAADLLRGVGLRPDEVRTTLEHRCLERVDVVDDEVLHTEGIDLGALLDALHEPRGVAAARDLARCSPSARRVLLAAVGEAARAGTATIGAGHVLLALRRSRDPVVAGTFAEHRCGVAELRDVVRRRGRRAG